MSRPYSSRSSSSGSQVRINGKIRAREVRVIGLDGNQMGIKSLGEAIQLARTHNVDLVEVAPNAMPPVCRLIDYGRYRYEQAKRDKESRKHQHATKVKEVQLSASIDSHDFSVKLDHAIGFFCEDMKVKVTLRFRGREMAHTDLGFQVVNKFIAAVAAYAHPDAEPKLAGRGLSVMLSPLPRAKRPKQPRGEGQETVPARQPEPDRIVQAPIERKPARPAETQDGSSSSSGFNNNPFADGLDTFRVAQ